jgi:hypothetical protein
MSLGHPIATALGAGSGAVFYYIGPQDLMDTAYTLHDLPNRRLVTEPIRDQDFPCHARCPLAVRTG